MKQIVVVGGGFAGVKLARELQGDKNFGVTLISSRDCFEYHAALYRSATGRSQLEVAVPLAEIFQGTNVKLVIDTVVKIDNKQRAVTCGTGTSYKYDELVLALGTVPAYFGINGLAEYSYGIKTISEAMRLKNHLHAELTQGHKPDLRYIVVGAGPSGVELAGEMVGYLRRLRRNHGIRTPFHVELVEAAPRILPTLPESISRAAERRLGRLGVKIYTSTAVKGETADQLQLPEGSVKTHTVIWTAGMTGSPLFGQHPKLFKLGKGGRVEVDEHLQAAPHIWVAGDSAASPKSGWAQTAIHDGRYLAKNFKRAAAELTLHIYQPPTPIAATPIGPHWCAVNLKGLQLFGYPGWLVRRWSDLQLYSEILPRRLAWRSWLYGSRIEESCPECMQRSAY